MEKYRALPALPNKAILVFGVLLVATFGSYFAWNIGFQPLNPESPNSFSFGTKLDTDVYIVTKNPDNYGNWLTQWWWIVTGKMTQSGDLYTIHWDRHAGIVTTIGKTFIQNKLGNDGFANATKYVTYISLSADAGGTNVADKQVASEITTNGCERVLGAFASTGANTWTVSNTFICDTGAVSNIQKCGYNWDSYAASPVGNLFGEDTFTAVTLQIADQLIVTGTFTVT